MPRVKTTPILWLGINLIALLRRDERAYLQSRSPGRNVV